MLSTLLPCISQSSVENLNLMSKIALRKYFSELKKIALLISFFLIASHELCTSSKKRVVYSPTSRAVWDRPEQYSSLSPSTKAHTMSLFYFLIISATLNLKTRLFHTKFFNIL
jgi:hypothetical protein